MNKELLLTLCLALSVLLSVSAVCASEITVTDSHVIGSNVGNDSSNISISSEEVLDSENSDDLSTNSCLNKLASNEENAISNGHIDVGDSSVIVTDGTYDMDVTFNDDSGFKLGASNGKIDVYFVAPDRTLHVEEIYDGYSYPIILRDVDGNGLANKQVTITFNGQTQTLKTNNRGWAYFNVSADDAGYYPVSLKFAGDSDYNSLSCPDFRAVTVIKWNVSFVAPNKKFDVEEIYNGYTYGMTLRDSNGTALAGKKITFTFNGKTQTKTTNANGRAYFNLSSGIGVHQLGIDFAGDTYYNALSDVKTITVIGCDVTFVAPNKKLYVDEIDKRYNYGLTLRDSNGTALAGKKVTVTFNGKTQTKTTNSNGRAYFNLTAGKYGSYPVNIDFAGDDYYNPLSDVRNITVVKYNVALNTEQNTFDLEEISTDGVTYPVLLRDSDGNPLEDEKVTVTFNGQDYVNVTDSNGYCYFNLKADKSGYYPATIKFAGTKYYYSKKLSKTIKVIPIDVAFTAEDKTIYVDQISGGYSYSVILKEIEGNVMANKKVTITFNGKKQSGRTDDSGVVIFTLTADKAGSYPVSLDFAGDSNHNPLSATNFKTVKVLAYDTKIAWKSETTFKSGTQTLKVLLTDSKNVALSGKTVKLTINSNTYSANTDSNGYATFNLKLGANTYTASYKFEGDNSYNPSSGSTVIKVTNSYEGFGYYVFGRDMKNVNLNTLASYGTTDLILNYYAIQLHGKSAVESWIASANKLGMRVHIWMQVYYDGSWINPISNGAYNTKFSDERIAEAVSYAKIKGVSGVLFDYLRYPGTAYKTAGGTDAITKFARLATDAIHKVNPNILVSAALMPETTSSIYYYGQDYSALSGILDLVLPMIYKGNYGKGSSWIASTTKWYVDNSKGADVWTTLQSYRSDDNPSKLPISELNNDVKVSLDAKASGVILFRYGLSNFVNFKNF